MPERSYDGPAIDASWQYITERPELDEEDDQNDALEGEDELVYATDPEPPGEERTEDVPIPNTSCELPEPVDESGQTAIGDWSGRCLP